MTMMISKGETKTDTEREERKTSVTGPLTYSIHHYGDSFISATELLYKRISFDSEGVEDFIRLCCLSN